MRQRDRQRRLPPPPVGHRPSRRSRGPVTSCARPSERDRGSWTPYGAGVVTSTVPRRPPDRGRRRRAPATPPGRRPAARPRRRVDGQQRVRVGGGQRLRDGRVERLGARVVVARRLVAAAGRAVAHHEQADPFRRECGGARPASAHTARSPARRSRRPTATGVGRPVAQQPRADRETQRRPFPDRERVETAERVGLADPDKDRMSRSSARRDRASPCRRRRRRSRSARPRTRVDRGAHARREDHPVRRRLRRRPKAPKAADADRRRRRQGARPHGIRRARRFADGRARAPEGHHMVTVVGRRSTRTGAHL